MRELISHIECQWYIARVIDSKGILVSIYRALIKGTVNNAKEIIEMKRDESVDFRGED